MRRLQDRGLDGQSLAYVYGHANQRDAGIAKALTLDEARRIAANIAKLPSLLAKGDWRRRLRRCDGTQSA
jgi:hypothetical protein